MKTRGGNMALIPSTAVCRKKTKVQRLRREPCTFRRGMWNGMIQHYDTAVYPQRRVLFSIR